MKKRENTNDTQTHSLKGQPNLAQGFGVNSRRSLGWETDIRIVRLARQGLSVGVTALSKEKMPEASNVYRKTNLDIGSTPPGSNVFHPNIFYKHTNPLGLSDFTSIR